MTEQNYNKNFGYTYEMDGIRKKSCWLIRFVLIKVKRVIKESFLFLNKKELERLDNVKRFNRNQFFIALFENLPQLVL